MTLIVSISGTRGTIGGKPSEGLTPDDIVKFSAAYASWLLDQQKTAKVVIGRDARISGKMVASLVSSTLLAMGIDVIDLGLSTTPTVEMAVTDYSAGGGIIITASHNPKHWNALKLLNEKGEFISAAEGKEILDKSNAQAYTYAEVDKLGKYSKDDEALDKHIQKILELPLVDVEAIKERNFKIAIDAVNSTGGIAIPKLLRALGVSQIIELYCEPTGKFPHNPEPLPEHLSALASEVNIKNADIGFTVDPDVDRLALVMENGDFFGEEYTLVAAADYVLQNTKGNTVSNLSSSKALRDITEKHGGQYHAAAVGEVNVVAKMKETNAVIGGEGNGGVIYPALHSGRDALVGIALILSSMAKNKKKASQLRAMFPNYYISKNKIELKPETNLDKILELINTQYKNYKTTTIDGVKIEFDNDWVHLRKSNTEPIIRIYAESNTQTAADNLAKKIISDIKGLL